MLYWYRFGRGIVAWEHATWNLEQYKKVPSDFFILLSMLDSSKKQLKGRRGQARRPGRCDAAALSVTLRLGRRNHEFILPSCKRVGRR